MKRKNNQIDLISYIHPVLFLCTESQIPHVPQFVKTGLINELIDPPDLRACACLYRSKAGLANETPRVDKPWVSLMFFIQQICFRHLGFALGDTSAPDIIHRPAPFRSLSFALIRVSLDLYMSVHLYG